MGAVAGYDIPYDENLLDDDEDRARDDEVYWADWMIREQDAVDRHYGI